MRKYYEVIEKVRRSADSVWYAGFSLDDALKEFYASCVYSDKYTKKIELREYELDDVEFNLDDESELAKALFSNDRFNIVKEEKL